MFQFPACPPVRLWIHLTVTGSSPAGFPHSDVNGSMPACGSPLLFAACHVLHRRMVPGHPPCALCSLIFFVADPETNCFLLPRPSAPLSVRLRPATGLPESSLVFAMRLSRCGFDRALKTIQMRNAQASASAVTHAEAWTACAWDLLPESKIRTNPQTAVPYAVAFC